MIGDWKPFPETAPKDCEILVRGRWKPTEDRLGGEIQVCVAFWGSIMSNATGYQWFIGFLSPMSSVNVDFTEWMEIPD